MGTGGLFAIHEGTGSDLQWKYYGWRFVDARPTRFGPLVWRAVELKGLPRVVVEGPASPGRARTATHNEADPRQDPWLYVLNPHLRRLAVLVAVPAPPLADAEARRRVLQHASRGPVKIGKAWYYSSNEGYTFVLVRSFEIKTDVKPDWDAVEREAETKDREAAARLLPTPR
jgi:hypothetical protein